MHDERPLQLDYERPLSASTAALIAELDGVVPAGKVIACVSACLTALREAGVREGLATATAAMARARLVSGTTGMSGTTSIVSTSTTGMVAGTAGIELAG